MADNKSIIRKNIVENKIVWAGLLVLALYLIFQLREVLLILFLAYISAVAILPFVEKLSGKNIPRLWASVLVFTLTLAVLLLIIVPMVPLVIGQIVVLFENIPEFVEELNQTLPIQIIPQDLLENLGGISDIGESLFRYTGSFFGAIFSFGFWLFSLFYFVVDKNKIIDALLVGKNKKTRDKVVQVESEVEANLGFWIRGQLLVSLLLGLMVWLAYTLLGLPFAFALALLAAILEIIPNLGPFIASIPALIVALTISPLMFLYVLGIFLIIQAIQNYVLSPVVMRKTVGLHPLVVVLLIISGTTLFGIWGALLAIPTATIIKTIWNNR